MHEAVGVRFLGCGDAFGSGGRFQTCIHVHADEDASGVEPARLLVDCGASSLVAMKRCGLGTADVDAIVLSHLHGDHFGGLPFFIMEAHYVSGREKPLVVAGPPGTESRVVQAMEVLFPGSSEAQRPFDLRFVEMTEGEPTPVGSASVTPFGVVHPSGAPSYALRIALRDKVLAFSGDTGWTEALIRVARDADLFVCECNFPKKVEGGHHLDLATLTEHRPRFGCRRLILTHMNEEVLAHLGSVDFDGASDGEVYTL